eukprot:CAMPEP_0170526306 /NCGR_PEP_ID=MMETSP0209-20121228/11754_1 /TAXON_ID=665100 ORGANISM="Litonotus pictus, Strain P1" /NCGR_SAMPLE_ID=MMETSP0209 /ASSEMBLY_ACC=CAM_ASM_000301 /LENGTH=428 /DNA_ID=CAMNT_0010816067 /DNA_START=244 /DNA_END=1527 /DNA_ORIENTATION=+
MKDFLKDRTKLKYCIEKIQNNDLEEEKKELFNSNELSEPEQEFFSAKCEKLMGSLTKKLKHLEKSIYEGYYKYYLNGKWTYFTESGKSQNKEENEKFEPVSWKESLKYSSNSKEDFIQLYNAFDFQDPKKNVEEENLNSLENETKSKEDDTEKQEKEEEPQEEEAKEENEEELVNPDDRVIKPSSGYNLDNLPEDAMGVSSPVHKQANKNVEHLKRKKPKYDARKAIEDAKTKEKEELEEGGKKDRDTFRNFIKSVKGGETGKSKDKNGINSNKGSKEKNLKNTFSKKPKNDQELEEELRQQLKQIDSGKNYDLNQQNKDTNRQPRRKEQTKEYEKRKRLHEMEKSPKRVQINKVRSRIDCWGQENASMPTYTQKKKANEVHKAKFNPQILGRIETEFSNINSRLNIQNFKTMKEEKFKELPIAYIKE